MSPVTTVNDANQRVMIELIGPGGSGKTTLAVAIQRQRRLDVVRVSHRKSARALLRSARAAIRAAVAGGLRPMILLNLWRKCAAVEQGMIAIAHRDGCFLVDEGPLRTLRDQKCLSKAELHAWIQFGESVLKRLADSGIHVVLVELAVEESLRQQRYEERTRQEIEHRKRRGGARNLIGLFLDDVIDSNHRIAAQEPMDEILVRSPMVSFNPLRLSASAQQDEERAVEEFAQAIIGSQPSGGDARADG